MGLSLKLFKTPALAVVYCVVYNMPAWNMQDIMCCRDVAFVAAPNYKRCAFYVSLYYDLSPRSVWPPETELPKEFGNQ